MSTRSTRKPRAARNRTIPSSKSVEAYIRAVQNARRRADCETVVRMMEAITGETPVMWGPSIIGFGSYHYVYESGREGDMPLTGVAPRKQSLVLYVMPGFAAYGELLEKLGKFRTGKSCLYVNKLEDVHMHTLRSLIEASVGAIREKYPDS